jgi:Raf kinase inhibitor-like YbhB/YbcL family protein
MLLLTVWSLLATEPLIHGVQPMKLSSQAFENNQPIPIKYTCSGQDTSPPLTISEVPTGTKTLCLIVEDPDTSHGIFDHWVTWNIPPNARMNEGEKKGVEGLNGQGKLGYHGPCPPPGPLHHYHFKAYALDIKLDLPQGASKAEVIKAMQGHILSQTELIGTFQR